MSYLPQAGVTDIINKGLELFGKAGSVVDIGVNVLEDPYLPQLGCEVNRLAKAYAKQNPGPHCAAPATVTSGGIGIRNFITPVRIYTFHVQHPWAVPLIGAAVVAGIFYAGYVTGKRKG